MQYLMENIPSLPLVGQQNSNINLADYSASCRRDEITSKEPDRKISRTHDNGSRTDLQALRRAHAARFAEMGLTPAEADIAAALVLGCRARDCAEARGITMNTVRTLRRRAYDKLGAADQIELMRRWAKL